MLAVTQATARFYLKAVFSKTEPERMNRQALIDRIREAALFPEPWPGVSPLDRK
jgi:hypothetical protein